MSILIDFAPEIEQQIAHLAVRRGYSTDALVREIVEQAIQTAPAKQAASDSTFEEQKKRNASTIALLNDWRRKGEEQWAAMTEAERTQEDANVEALMESLRENRRSSGDYPLPS